MKEADREKRKQELPELWRLRAMKFRRYCPVCNVIVDSMKCPDCGLVLTLSIVDYEDGTGWHNLNEGRPQE